MNMNHVLHGLKTVLFVAPLLAGCGSGSSTVMVAPGGLTLPDCPDGSLLGLDSNNALACVSPPAGSLNTSACAPNTQAINSDDGMTIKCVDKGTGTTDTSTTARIQQDQTNVNNLQTQVSNVASGGAKSYYQGTTTTSYNGTFNDGNGTGIRNAAAICNTSFPGSHMCSVFEMYDSVVLAGSNAADKFNPANNLAKAWVYQESWHAPLTTTTMNEPAAGLADNCASGEYGTADQGWKGTVVSWEPLQYNAKMALKFTSGATIACNQSYPIACCK